MEQFIDAPSDVQWLRDTHLKGVPREKAHAQAALALAKKMGWMGDMIGGSTKAGYCFVFVDGAEVYSS